MWVFTKIGFFSAVEHKARRGCIIVRARRREHLEALADKTGVSWKIESTPERDYPFRAEMSSASWALVLSTLAREIDYPNFKDAAKKGHSKHWREALLDVWGVMVNWQRKEEESR